MKKGRAGTMTHDYKRNGTTTLFAALNVLTGVVIGECLPRHRHDEFLKFLRKIDREVPKGLAVHMILDNYATHKHPKVVQWLEKHPRFHLHFTPTSSSWLNLVERWFRELTDKAIRRGVFGSVPTLIAAIEEYLEANNDDPKGFVWTATAEQILEKVRRGRAALDQITALKLRHCTRSSSVASLLNRDAPAIDQARLVEAPRRVPFLDVSDRSGALDLLAREQLHGRKSQVSPVVRTGWPAAQGRTTKMSGVTSGMTMPVACPLGG